MGFKWEVLVWGKHYPGSDMLSDMHVYGGDSLFAALVAFWKSHNKYGCVTLKYRGGKC